MLNGEAALPSPPAAAAADTKNPAGGTAAAEPGEHAAANSAKNSAPLAIVQREPQRAAVARPSLHRSIRVDTSVQAPESIAQASCAKCGGLMEVGALLGCYGALPW
eukprot:COSAG03_NODE_7140_length_958_cov_1.235157_1_plen_106_part_00